MPSTPKVQKTVPQFLLYRALSFSYNNPAVAMTAGIQINLDTLIFDIYTNDTTAHDSGYYNALLDMMADSVYKRVFFDYPLRNNAGQDKYNQYGSFGSEYFYISLLGWFTFSKRYYMGDPRFQ
jgi:hypothetical protein